MLQGNRESRPALQPGINTIELLGISKGKTLAFMKSYYDASYILHPNAQRKPYVLGGCMMTSDAWLKLESNWNPILVEFGITAYRSSDCNASKNEFDGWDGPTKDDLRARLIGSIRQSWSGTEICAVFPWFALDSVTFDRVAMEFPDVKISIYEFGLIIVLAASKYAIAKHQQGIHTMGLFFEEGEDVRPHVRKYLREEMRTEQRIVDISFVEKADHVPLQIADLLAYEVMKSEFEGTRKTLVDLIAIGASGPVHYDEDNIRSAFKNRTWPTV